MSRTPLRGRAAGTRIGGRSAAGTSICRRLALPVVALLGLLLLGTSPALAASWKTSASTSGGVSMAKLGSSFTFLSGTGTVSSDGSTYTVSSIVTGSGYLDLVNNSTIPVKLSMQVQVGSLVAGTTVVSCSLAWNSTAGTCPGTSTTIADSAALANTTSTYTATTATAAGDRLRMRVKVGGVAGGTTLTALPVVPRAAADRTVT